MANFSVNEVRQFYVVNRLITGGEVEAAGDLKIKEGSDGEHLWFEYWSPNGGAAGVGGAVRTDLIEKGKVAYVKDSHSTMPAQTPFPKKEISLNPDLNGGAPVVGQKYIFRVRFYGMGVGGNNIQYSKSSGVYTAKVGDTAEDIFEELVKTFNDGIKSEPEQWVLVYVDGGGNSAKIVVESSNTAEGTSSESLRPYVRGKKSGDPIRFELNVSQISYTNQVYP